jgi:hypothetical protein
MSQMTLTARTTDDGLLIEGNGSLGIFEAACLTRELARMVSKYATPKNVNEKGLLLIGEIVNKLHQLTDDGRYFPGIVITAPTERREVDDA